MRSLMFMPCVALVLAAAAPAATNPPVASQIAPVTDAQQAVDLRTGGGAKVQATDEKKVCRQLPTTGSRLAKRACLTEKQWTQVEQDLQH